MEEMASVTKQNANNAQETEKIVNQAATDTQRGGEIVQKAIDAINSINENITIIQDIAFQTSEHTCGISLDPIAKIPRSLTPA